MRPVALTNFAMHNSSDLEPEAGSLQKLADNFYRLCAPNPSFMTGMGTNTYIYGDSELAVFDAGPAIDKHAKSILSVQETLDAPITHIFVSHTHMDHSPCTQLLKKSLPEAICIGIPAEPNQPFEDHTFRPELEPKDLQIIDFASGQIQAICTPGHVANHVCWLLKEHGVLLTGDHLMSGSTVVIIPPKGDMSAYIASLEKIQRLRFELIAPGHGSLIFAPHKLIDWTIKHRFAREAKVLSAISNKPSPLDALVSSVYDDVERHLYKIAKYSLHAHLLKLERENKVRETELGWVLD